MNVIRSWKKVLENDLDYVASELKDAVGRPAAIILSGPVGAGKTTFTKKFVSGDQVQSPTYSIVNELGEMVHADFYRIKNAEEITHLELPLYLEGKEFVLIEWGMPYIREIKKILDENFSFYELEIQINTESSDKKGSTRNYLLRQIPD